jgi:hypothetical protein
MSDPLARTQQGCGSVTLCQEFLPSLGSRTMGDVKEKVFGSRQGRPVGYTYIPLAPLRCLVTLFPLVLT